MQLILSMSLIANKLILQKLLVFLPSCTGLIDIANLEFSIPTSSLV